MRTKVTLFLLFLNVALFYFIFYVDTAGPQVVDTGRVIGAEAANIQSLVITTADSTVHLRRQADTWLITQPITWAANEVAVTRILNELQYGLIPESTFEVADLAKTGQTLADYGLEKPSLTLAFTPAPSDAVPQPADITLKIGNATKSSNRLYILSPDGHRIHVVRRSLAESLAIKFEDLRSSAIFTIPVFQARSLTLEPASAARLRFRRDNDRWNLELLLQTRANKTDTEIALSRLGTLAVKSFPDQRNTAGTGLSTPSLRITIEGNNRTETLLLGARVEQPAPTSPPAADEEPSTEFYAIMGEEKTDASTLFTVAVPNTLLETLKNAQRDLRERHVLDFDPAAVTALSLSAPQQTVVTLHRLEGSTASWQIVRRSSENAPQTLPADRATVERLLKDLSLLSAEEFENDAPSEAEIENYGFTRPSREITLTSGNSSITVQIGQSSEHRAYARLTGQNQNYIYRVSSEIINQIPLSPLNYRERVLRDLPAGAQITSLKLTDESSASVLLETAVPLPAATPPGLNRSATEALLAQVHTLRAKTFLSESFTKTILTNGEERPWKLRLDLTLSLVSGTGAQTTNSTLYFSERTGGGQQLVGSPEFDVTFTAEQPLIDALFALTYGPSDPGPATK